MEVYEEVVDTHLADEFQKEFRRFALAAAEHPEHWGLINQSTALVKDNARCLEPVGLSPPGCETRDFGPNFPSSSSFVFTQTPQTHENSDSTPSLLAQTSKVRQAPRTFHFAIQQKVSRSSLFVTTLGNPRSERDGCSSIARLHESTPNPKKRRTH